MARRPTVAVTIADRADELTDEAMECRDLLHAWPRPKVKAHADLISFEITARISGHPSAARRIMTCTGGCGVSKTQRYRITRDGRMQRDGTPQYTYPEKGYRLRPVEKGQHAPTLDRDALRYTLLSRLYPKLAW
jgi:hypothetical protein